MRVDELIDQVVEGEAPQDVIDSFLDEVSKQELLDRFGKKKAPPFKDEDDKKKK